MRWEQGCPVIDAMLAAGELQKVPVSRRRADQLLRQAAEHLVTARAAAERDTEGAYALAYDAARKALVALLENEGLRPTSRAGHHGTYAAVSAQLDPPLGKTLRPFERMRRRRNEVEYPNFVEAPLSAHDVEEDVRAAEAIITLGHPCVRRDVAVLRREDARALACGIAEARLQPFCSTQRSRMYFMRRVPSPVA